MSERASLSYLWGTFLEETPLLLAPIATQPAFRVDAELDPDRLAGWPAALRMIVAVNLLGLPAVAVPVGEANGLPQAVQVIGPRFREDLCLDAAEAIEEPPRHDHADRPAVECAGAAQKDAALIQSARSWTGLSGRLIDDRPRPSPHVRAVRPRPARLSRRADHPRAGARAARRPSRQSRRELPQGRRARHLRPRRQSIPAAPSPRRLRARRSTADGPRRRTRADARGAATLRRLRVVRGVEGPPAGGARRSRAGTSTPTLSTTRTCARSTRAAPAAAPASALASRSTSTTSPPARRSRCWCRRRTESWVCRGRPSSADYRIRPRSTPSSAWRAWAARSIVGSAP